MATDPGPSSNLGDRKIAVFTLVPLFPKAPEQGVLNMSTSIANGNSKARDTISMLICQQNLYQYLTSYWFKMIFHRQDSTKGIMQSEGKSRCAQTCELSPLTACLILSFSMSFQT